MVIWTVSVAWAAEVPVKLAEQARLQLKPAEGVELLDVALTVGGAWMDPGSAEGAMRDLTFPIDHWRWTDATLSFTPTGGGGVELFLIGPWEEKKPGEVWRQEVLWDDVSAAGSEVENGSFATGIEGWSSPWMPFPDEKEWPLEGMEAGASWLGRPLVQTLRVTKDQRVALRFKARAAVPEGFRVMPKGAVDSPAHRFAAKLRRGVNLGNCWEAPVGSWGVPYGPEDIDRIADAGFDHVRVPVGWHHRMDGGGISSELLSELEPVMRRALDRGLRVLLDWHAFRELEENPEAHEARFIEGWKVIAGHFKDWSPDLALELLNEPTAKLHGERLNALHAETLAAIRGIDPERIIVINPGRWAVADQLGLLWIPEKENRVMVSFHCYDPFPFTHQKAGWVGYEEVKDVRFPGPPLEPASAPPEQEGLRNWFDAYSDPGSDPNPSSIHSPLRLLRKAAEWSQVFGRPVHLGEFGCVRNADADSRKRYARQMREAAEKLGVPWCWWEWKVGFGVVEMQTGEPLLIDELTGK